MYSLLVGVLVAATAAAEWQIHASPFGDKGVAPEPRFGRPAPFAIHELLLDLAVDFEGEEVAGTAVYTLSPTGRDRAEITLDAVGLQVEGVTVNGGAAADFEVAGEGLSIFFDTPRPAGENFRLAIDYRVTRPERGLYFRTPRLGYRDEETQVWSQGQPEDARYWFPSHDFPNQRMRSGMRVRVPEGFTALSNGHHVDTVAHHDGTVTWVWQLEEDHVAYLVSLIAGRFSEIRDEGGGVPLHYYVAPGREDAARTTFARTPAMMEWLQEVLAVPYPYERYSQVTVVDFIAGGMENTAKSTLTDAILHTEEVGDAYDADWLIMHELAHQWFGDLVTCRDWSHLWLNEGFASYFESLWHEQRHGADGLDRDLAMRAERILQRDRGDERMSLVLNVYGTPGQRFDRRVYDKGAWVLHMLRRKLGDELFWQATRAYLETHRNEVVETRDLLRVFERETGKSLERFFDQWLHKSGFPVFAVRSEWDRNAGAARLEVRQTQTVDERTPVFEVQTAVLFKAGGAVHRHELAISRTDHTFHIPLPARPEWILFDPDFAVLAEVNFPRSKAQLLAQLADGDSYRQITDALDGLARLGGADTAEAMGGVLAGEGGWQVRTEAAQHLRNLDVPEALAALTAWEEDWHPRVLRAVALALAAHRHPDAVASLRTLAEKAGNPYVLSAAIEGLGRHGDTDALPLILRAANRDSHREVVRQAAFDALARLGGTRNAEAIARHTDRDATRDARVAAISALGRAGRWLDDTRRTRRTLEALLEDPYGPVRHRAAEALETLGDPQAIAPLERFVDTEKRPDIRQTARERLERLRNRDGLAGAVEELRRELERQKEETDRLRERMKRLEERDRSTEADQEEEDGAEGP